jgi:branched-chain amino acid transport system ATP-binding protein
MLELDGISAGYGDTPVLRDVHLSVPAGAVVALLGANGAGKTTLLRVASGLLVPTAGHVRLDEQVVTGQAPAALAARGLCHVPEGRGVFPNLTVRENLVLFAVPGDEEAGIDRAVTAFPRLGERLDQLAGTMSGGEQQMLALARAYVRQARIVLLDEVSMGLAPRVVDEIFLFLTRLASDGVALLLVEQFVTKALAVARYVSILKRGQIVFAGEPAELQDEDVFARYLGVEEPSLTG